jgi:hypothetical protein
MGADHAQKHVGDPHPGAAERGSHGKARTDRAAGRRFRLLLAVMVDLVVEELNRAEKAVRGD